MTTLTFHVSRALAREWQRGRRGDRHRARSPRQRRSVARGRARRGDDGPHGAVRHRRPESSTGGARTRRSRRGRGCWRSAPPRTRSVRSPTWPRRRVWRTTRARSSSSMRSTSRRTLSSTSRAIGCDLLACSPYKFYGPHLGILYVRRDLLERLDVPKVEPARTNAPDRLETGTLSTRRSSAPRAAVDFLAALSPGSTGRREALQNTMAGLHERNQRQVTRLWTALRELPGVSVYGPPPIRPRTSTLSFVARRCAPRRRSRATARRAGCSCRMAISTP